jgi:hypothetical protein
MPSNWNYIDKKLNKYTLDLKMELKELACLPITVFHEILSWLLQEVFPRPNRMIRRGLSQSARSASKVHWYNNQSRQYAEYECDIDTKISKCFRIFCLF